MDVNQGKIFVTYKVIDGAHFFIAADKKAAGLCVAHEDLEVAYYEVGEQLSKIVYFNTGEKVSYYPAIPLEEFKKLIDAYQAVTKLASGDITSAATQSWMINSSVQGKAKEVA
jgi:anionic cell wall polymer biosynthesis LytR-Cps2A-Psr (LCP) family protein